MRILTLSLIMTCVACAQAPQPVQRKPVASTPAVSTTSSATAEDAAAESAADQIPAADIEAVMNSGSAAPGAMDMAAMGQQVQSAFAQSNLTPEQNSAMSETSMALIAAANAGDQVAVKDLSNKLAKQALLGKGIIGFGLVDPAAIVAAIMDLIAAAADADVAGIMDAIMDLVAAIGA
ncbi:MAG: hypothetical protein M3Q07_15455 [Pseudobdellovibrionaceae bacterium]|nr:hypothetical protein [Pseudobdellovibrionaceae bacterium]